MAKFIVTSALPYSYSIPHLGNFVGSVLPADVYFKYLQMCGEDAIFICGSDQHGTPIELRAIKEGTTPEILSDDIHNRIKDLFGRFECTFTYYGKTHSESNKETVYEVFAALQKNGYIIETEAQHAYCEIDKRFLVDRFIEGTCPYCKGTKARGDQCDDCGKLLEPTQLVDPHCTICGKDQITFKKVQNLALDLAKLQGKIESFVDAASENGWSKNAMNKTLGSLKTGLKPRDITRNMEWGFPVPVKGFERTVFYVWFDAILGYLSITKEWDKNRWRDYWMDKETRLVQFMGKDNIEFHTIIWPGTLIGADMGLALPKTIYALEYLTSKTLKFSKSGGVGLNIETALGIADADYWRFALMSMLPETSDSEFTTELLMEAVNKIMNGKIGNLIHRVLVIARANRERIKMPITEMPADVSKMIKRYRDNFDSIKLREAQRALIDLAEVGNALVNATEPWALAKAAPTDEKKEKEFSEVMGKLIRIIYSISVLLYPFTPEASKKALAYFGQASSSIDMLSAPINIDFGLEPKPIFKKLEPPDLGKFEEA